MVGPFFTELQVVFCCRLTDGLPCKDILILDELWKGVVIHKSQKPGKGLSQQEILLDDTLSQILTIPYATGQDDSSEFKMGVIKKPQDLKGAHGESWYRAVILGVVMTACTNCR